MTSAALQRQADEAPVPATARAALYLRVSTPRQADTTCRSPTSGASSRAIASRTVGRLRPSSWSRATPRPTIAGLHSRR